jgi:flagellar basal-body rod protein FlgC
MSMSDLFQSLTISASGLAAQSTRLRHVSENIANVDTPGYRRKLVPFQQILGAQGATGAVTTGDVRLDQTELPSVWDPSHPLADDTGHYEASNVDLLIELTDARQAQRSYEANLSMFDQARGMSTSLLELLRR